MTNSREHFWADNEPRRPSRKYRARFGADFRTLADDTFHESTDTNDPPQTVATQFPVNVSSPGRYRISAEYRWNLSATSQDFRTYFADSLDLYPLGTVNIEPKDSTNFEIANVYGYVDVPVSGPIVWELRFGSEMGATASISFVRFEWWRTGDSPPEPAGLLLGV